MTNQKLPPKITHYTYMDSPIGQLLLAGCKDHLRNIQFPSGKHSQLVAPEWQSGPEHFIKAKDELAAYFKGELHDFSLPLVFEGTDFQNDTWRALCDISYGTVASYGDVAKTIGRPKASRAVGAANGLNPLPIIVPCHRVIGANKTLTGFGGGLEVKKYLLDLEARFDPNSERLI